MPDSSIPSATSIPSKPISIPGGLTVSKAREKNSRVAYWLLWPQPVLPTSWKKRRFTEIFGSDRSVDRWIWFGTKDWPFKLPGNEIITASRTMPGFIVCRNSNPAGWLIGLSATEWIAIVFCQTGFGKEINSSMETADLVSPEYKGSAAYYKGIGSWCRIDSGYQRSHCRINNIHPKILTLSWNLSWFCWQHSASACLYRHNSLISASPESRAYFRRWGAVLLPVAGPTAILIEKDWQGLETGRIGWNYHIRVTYALKYAIKKNVPTTATIIHFRPCIPLYLLQLPLSSSDVTDGNGDCRPMWSPLM